MEPYLVLVLHAVEVLGHAKPVPPEPQEAKDYDDYGEPHEEPLARDAPGSGSIGGQARH